MTRVSLPVLLCIANWASLPIGFNYCVRVNVEFRKPSTTAHGFESVLQHLISNDFERSNEMNPSLRIALD